MIHAFIFDLDGTLVQTERLKAMSYARAAMELKPDSTNEADGIEAFKQVVGLSRRKVAKSLLERFGLEQAAAARMEEFGVSAPWQAFVQVRLAIYEDMLADPAVLRSSQWPHNMDLLKRAREAACKVGLATMSRCEQTRRVLEILELTEAFDFVATRDDVELAKPDPEIDLLVAHELGIEPPECLVIEDSPSGVKAAKAAGMWCIAVATPFTRAVLHTGGLLDERWIVDHPDELLPTVGEMLELRRGHPK